MEAAANFNEDSLSGPTPASKIPEREWSFDDLIKSLPSDTEEIKFIAISHAKRLADRKLQELAEGKSSNQFLYFSQVPPNDLETILEDPQALGKSNTITFDRNRASFILKVMLSPPHAVAVQRVTQQITLMSYQMGLDCEPTGGAGKDLGGIGKQPDASYVSGETGLDEWPSFVLEVGLSQSLSSLGACARLWIENSEGRTNAVLVVSIHQARPEICFRLYQSVERDNPAARTGSLGRTVDAQMVTETVVSGEPSSSSGPEEIEDITITGMPLVLPFYSFFGRSPNLEATPPEHDFVFGERELELIARKVWRRQEFSSADRVFEQKVSTAAAADEF